MPIERYDSGGTSAVDEGVLYVRNGWLFQCG